jgi:hypothetical protein
MLEQTDEPSPEESLRRYAEYKFKYIEVREASVFVFWVVIGVYQCRHRQGGGGRPASSGAHDP